MRTKSKWSPGPGIKVQSIASNGDGDWVVSACGPSSGICPDCRHQSRSRHGWSYRCLQDLPIQGNEVTVKLQLSRWRCTYRPLNIKGAQIYGRRIIGRTGLRGTRFHQEQVFLPRGNRQSGSHAPM
ncbi:transposase family protein [Rhizobium ruizarguesonis]|nr:transposase family protein [Rhizobium ruizarguesonis]TAV19587.1 transposase family protein [Rhizobium ruizarguesonis]